MNQDNKNNIEHSKATHVKETFLVAWSNSLLRKIIRFITLCFISFMLLISLFVVSLPLFNLSFLDSYVNEYMKKHTNLIFNIHGKMKVQIIPEFHLYVESLSFKEREKKVKVRSKNAKKRFAIRKGVYYSSKDLNLVMPIGKMLRTDFRVDKISASALKFGYNNYKFNFSPLEITNVDDNFKILMNSISNKEKVTFQAKFQSLSPQDIRGDIHLGFKHMDLKFRIDKYSLGKPLQGYIDFNARDMYDLVHLWGFEHHTKKWGFKGDINLAFQQIYQSDITDEIHDINNNLQEIAIKEPNIINISKSVYEKERDKKQNDITKFFTNIKKELQPVTVANTTSTDQDQDKDKDQDQDQDDKDNYDGTNSPMVTNLILKSNKINAYYTSKQGFKAKGTLKNVTYDFSGRTTHATGDFTGYKGGTAHAEVIKAGSGHIPMIINAQIHGNDFNEIIGVVGYPYHSKKFNIKARVILRYLSNRRSGVYVDHITSDYTSNSDEKGSLTGNFFYGWKLGELYSEAIAHNKQNIVNATISIKKFHDPVIFDVKGHGQTFSDAMKLGNIPLLNTLNKFNLKTKIKITNHDVYVQPISLNANLYHKNVFIEGDILQNFHRKFHLSHVNLTSGHSHATAVVSQKGKDDVHIKIRGQGKNVQDVTKIFNFKLNSQKWDTDIDLSIPVVNKQTSIMINQMDAHVKFNKDMDFKTTGIAELNYKNQHLIGNVKVNFNNTPINLQVDNIDDKNILTFSSKGKDLNKIYKLGDLKFNTKRWSTSGNITLPYDWKNGTLLLDKMKTNITTTSGFNLETLSDTKIHLKNLTTDSNVKIISGDNSFYAKVIRDTHESIIAYIHGKGKSLRNILSFIDNVNLDTKWNIKGNVLWNPKHGKSLFVKKINMQVGQSDLKGDVIFDGSKVIKKTDLPDILINLKSKNINLNDFKEKTIIKKKKKMRSKIFSKDKFNLEGVKKWHVNGNVHIDHFQQGLMKLTDADMHVSSKSGIITAKGKVYINRGFADALLRLNTQSFYPQLKLVMNINDMPMEEVSKVIGIEGIIRGGLLNTKINLFTFGKSSYEMASNLNGIIQSTVGSGEIGSNLLNFASVDIISSPLSIFTGVSKYKKLVCGAVNLKINKGKINGAPLLALKTKNIDIALSGRTDIANEHLNTRLIVYSRDGLGLSLTNLTGGYDLKGDYNNIYFGKSLTDILAIGAKGTAAWFTFGASVLATGLFQKTQNTANVCTSVMNN